MGGRILELGLAGPLEDVRLDGERRKGVRGRLIRWEQWRDRGP